MINELVILLILIVFLMILCISVGKTLMNIELYRQSNKKLRLEQFLLDQKERILKDGKKVAMDLEDVLYKARIQQQIDDMSK